MTAFITRRGLIRGAGAVTASATLAGPALLEWAHAWAQTQPFEPEKGARLRLTRWRRFIAAEDESFMRQVDAFTKATGIRVRLESESLEDVRTKAAVAANVGQGPDMIWTLFSDAHLYPDKLVDVSDVAQYLGNKYGGWYPLAQKYGTYRRRWISIPIAVNGNYINYRVSWVKEAGFDKFPTDMDGFMQLAKDLERRNHPMGFALGNASGDGNAWTHWVLWAFGGKVVDENDRVVINAPETIRALEYVKELVETFVPGTASWLDPHNNKAFLDQQISVTNNGISIYVAAQNDNQPWAEDIDHAFYPVGPAGKPTELHVPYPMMIYKYSKYPKAAKALTAFLLESKQQEDWLQGAQAYLTQTLKSYAKHPVWTENPKRLVFRDATERSLDIGHAGSLGYAAAGVFADFVVVNMFADVAVGGMSPKEAAAKAEKRAERYYKV
jgi:multiple sugar transport system substrate-binding protein